MELEFQKDKEEVIRACLKMKDELLTDLIHDLNNIDEDPLSSEELKKVMHKRGLPLRYLGKICSHAALNHTREVAVIEIIARASQILIKDGLVFLSEDQDSGFSK